MGVGFGSSGARIVIIVFGLPACNFPGRLGDRGDWGDWGDSSSVLVFGKSGRFRSPAFKEVSPRSSRDMVDLGL